MVGSNFHDTWIVLRLLQHILHWYSYHNNWSSYWGLILRLIAIICHQKCLKFHPLVWSDRLVFDLVVCGLIDPLVWSIVIRSTGIWFDCLKFDWFHKFNWLWSDRFVIDFIVWGLTDSPVANNWSVVQLNGVHFHSVCWRYSKVSNSALPIHQRAPWTILRNEKI